MTIPGVEPIVPQCWACFCLYLHLSLFVSQIQTDVMSRDVDSEWRCHWCVTVGMATKTEECNDSKEFDAFFEEVKDIEKNTGAHEPDLQGSDEELSKLPDGVCSVILVSLPRDKHWSCMNYLTGLNFLRRCIYFDKRLLHKNSTMLTFGKLLSVHIMFQN